MYKKARILITCAVVDLHSHCRGRFSHAAITSSPSVRKSSQNLPSNGFLHFPKMATLETLNFDNKALRDLPVDPNEETRVRQVSGACFSKVVLEGHSLIVLFYKKKNYIYVCEGEEG